MLIIRLGTQWLNRISARSTGATIWKSVKHHIGQSRFHLHATGKTRRFYLVHFRKSFVRQQLRTRSGHCRQCGFCCNMLFTCPMLTNGRKCMVHGRCRPDSCKVFPIDQRDIEEVRLSNGDCGYHFKKRQAQDCDHEG